jgi:hypothetical protein
MDKAKNKETLVTVPEAGLLALVASKLKGVVLFPKNLNRRRLTWRRLK